MVKSPAPVWKKKPVWYPYKMTFLYWEALACSASLGSEYVDYGNFVFWGHV
jgi:hypothetical protein